jgi:hypothetical protein
MLDQSIVSKKQPAVKLGVKKLEFLYNSRLGTHGIRGRVKELHVKRPHVVVILARLQNLSFDNNSIQAISNLDLLDQMYIDVLGNDSLESLIQIGFRWKLIVFRQSCNNPIDKVCYDCMV